MRSSGADAGRACFGASAVPHLGAGRLLVASPALRDPQFFRTVVLLLEADSSGALGLVLNRPSQSPVELVLPGWADAASPPARMHVGGPVSPSSAIALGARRTGADTAGFAALHDADGSLLLWGTVDLDADPALVVPALTAMRVFVGYAGWDAEQLAAEVSAGAWYVLDPGPGDAFTATPDGLWAAVLTRQGGSFTHLATMPPDPTLN